MEAYCTAHTRQTRHIHLAKLFRLVLVTMGYTLGLLYISVLNVVVKLPIKGLPYNGIFFSKAGTCLGLAGFIWHLCLSQRSPIIWDPILYML